MDRRERLEAARDTLQGLLSVAGEGTAPGISRELRAVLAESDSLPAANGKSTQDELKERRAQRLADAKARARSAESK